MKPFEEAIDAKPSLPNTGGWKDRHYRAVVGPNQAQEQPLIFMLKGWYNYAKQHEERFESLIGDDGFLGPEWEAIGDALRALLNGDCGRLDCGTIDGFLLNTMRDNGVDDTENK